MWTYSLIAQAIGWITLTLASPFIFVFTRKVAKYISYKTFPRDVIIEYKSNNETTEAYYLKYPPFGKPSLIKLSKDELARIEASI